MGPCDIIEAEYIFPTGYCIHQTFHTVSCICKIYCSSFRNHNNAPNYSNAWVINNFAMYQNTEKWCNSEHYADQKV